VLLRVLILLSNLIYIIYLNYFLLLVQIEDFHDDIIISETKNQFILDDQQDSVNSYTDSVGDKSSKCAEY